MRTNLKTEILNNERHQSARFVFGSQPANCSQLIAPSETRTDSQFLQRALSGAANAWEELFNLHAAKLYRKAYTVLRSKEDAEDAVQDAWFRAHNNLKSFQGRSSFSTWLTRIVINSSLMILRKKRNAHEVSADELDEGENSSFSLQLFDPAPNPERAYAEQERRSLLNEAIGSLRPRLRTAVQIGKLRDLSLKETARELGVSVEAVKGQLFHARVALRKSRVLKALVRAEAGIAA